jgi:hypothetical protein
VWNEPNIAAYGRPRPDPAAFATLYAATRRAIRDVSPAVTVVVGGLSGYEDPGGFLRAMLAARPDLAGAIDAVGAHPYAAGAKGTVEMIVTCAPRCATSAPAPSRSW